MSSTLPQSRKTINQIDIYTPGKSHAAAGTKVYKLSSNENPLGPSLKAVEAARAALDNLALYPDGYATPLREAIASRFGLDPARIVCGAGSDELLSLLAYAYLEPGDEAIYPQYGFLVYRIAILAAGGEPVIAPEKNHTVDVDAILARVTERTKIVFLANPANPTGTYIPFEDVKRLQKGLPSHVLLVLDSAYAEYVRRNDYSAGLELVATCDNVVMTRTFSKVYGLAGLRIGWMVAPAPVVDTINRIRGPFNINSTAQAAGVAAIQDDVHLSQSIDLNEKGLDYLYESLTALGLEVTQGVANFVLVHFPETGRTAQDADSCLLQQGIIVRRVTSYGLPNALRITIGTMEANTAVVNALTHFMAKS